MELWAEIRRRILIERVSRRQVLRETGMHWKTLKKTLKHAAPPGYRQGCVRSKPRTGPYVERIRQIIKEDQALPKKQRHTAKRIYERLKAEGYAGSYVSVARRIRTDGCAARKAARRSDWRRSGRRCWRCR